MNPPPNPDNEVELASSATLGQGPPGNRVAELALVVVFLAIVASVALIQTAVELQRGGGVRALEVFSQQPTSGNLRAYEHRLEDASVVARAIRPWFQFVQFRWLGDGGEKALVGRDGWLFYKPGFDAMLARAGSGKSPSNDPAVAIVAWRDALAARGIQLLVVPAPNKESLYADRLTRRLPAEGSVASPAMRGLLARLEEAGVACVDLIKVFAEARTNTAPLYLAQDSHWSPEGVSLAAKAVSRRLAEKGWIRPGGTRYREQPMPVFRVGDVVRMLQSPRIEESVVAERVQGSQVVDGNSGQLYKDETTSDVLVLGDSFLRIYQQDEPGSAGFVAHLAKEINQPLTSLVSDGGASTLVRQELYRRPALLKNKRVVVWEFVERDIRLGAEGWQQVPLPP